MSEGRNFEWALAAMKAGKQVRRKEWGNKSARISLRNEQIEHTNSFVDGVFHPSERPYHRDILANDWEEYVEPRKYIGFVEAMRECESGKMMRRESWGTGYLKDNDYGPRRYVDDCSWPYGAIYADISATDWYVVE